MHSVYILASRPHGALYVGMTNDLPRRMAQHRAGTGSTHAARYNIRQLVWCMEHADFREASAHERRLKRWHRRWKIELIEQANPDWRDLSREWR